VFLGIENVLDQDLAFLKAKAKNARREGGRTTGSATYRAVELLRRHGLLVVGGLIVGNPGDTEASIQANLDFARKYVDWPYIQHPTPYPGTPAGVGWQALGAGGTAGVTRPSYLCVNDHSPMRMSACGP